MLDPIAGHLGALVLTGWVAPAPTGQDEAFLLLTTDDSQAPQTMPAVADLLGLTGPPGSASTDPAVYVTLGEGWLTLHGPEGQRFTRPSGPEWSDTAAITGRVVLVVGAEPMPVGMHPDDYTDRCGATSRIGLVPFRKEGS